MPVQVRNDELVELLRGDFQARYEPNFAHKSMASLIRGIPGLRVGWTMGSFDENGDQFDVSGQGRTLSYNGNPTYGYAGLAPYVDLDGTGDYLRRADEAGLDILGTETYVAAAYRGLTCGLWFSPDRLTGNEKLIYKANGGGYILEFRGDVANDPVRFGVGDGVNPFDYASLASVVDTTGAWYFAAGRFDPSTELKVWIGAAGTLQSATTVAGIPAAIGNSTNDLTIGSDQTVTYDFDGKLGAGFLSAMYLSDAYVAYLFEQVRAMYGA